MANIFRVSSYKFQRYEGGLYFDDADRKARNESQRFLDVPIVVEGLGGNLVYIFYNGKRYALDINDETEG